MNSPAIKRDHHYVPQFLLRNFAIPADRSKVMEYRLLVEHEAVPLWESRSIKSVAKHRDLYTVSHGQAESDELERWLDKHFENPAMDAVSAVLKNAPLTDADLKFLCNLYAAQFMRTPLHFLTKRDLWARELNKEVEKMKAKIVGERPGLDIAEGQAIDIHAAENLPMRVRISRTSDKYHMLIQTVNGRKLWMWGVRHALRPHGPLRSLQSYPWSILLAPQGQNWFCSDNPAVSSLTFKDGSKTSFANWATPNARLMLPLSSKHLLYYRVGSPLSEQYTEASALLAKQIRQDLADAAYRSVFSSMRHDDLSNYRIRKEDSVSFAEERKAWASFGAEQWEAEQFRDIHLPAT